MAGVRWETQGRWDGCRYVVSPELFGTTGHLPIWTAHFPGCSLSLSCALSSPPSILHPFLPSTANEVINFILMEPYFKMIIVHKDIGLNIFVWVIKYLYAG